MYDLVSWFIACLTCYQIDQRPGTNFLRVIRIPLGGEVVFHPSKRVWNHTIKNWRKHNGKVPSHIKMVWLTLQRLMYHHHPLRNIYVVITSNKEKYCQDPFKFSKVLFQIFWWCLQCLVIGMYAKTPTAYKRYQLCISSLPNIHHR